MNELFRNFGLSTNVSANYSSENLSNPFVGNVVVINNIHLRLEELIAEGGFGYVFRARDSKTSKLYAVKRMISSDDEAKNDIENEISILERVQSHKHIMEFYGFEICKPNIYYLLCEYCGSGSLKDLNLPIVNKQLLNRIVYQISLALEKLHLFNIIHRDIKIENILFSNDGFIKICDFGSATDKSFKPDHNWTPIQRSLLEDEMNRHTTPMYRPPEILDTYLHYEINTAMDIWAFGCLIFCLRFGQHPFEDSSKLRIINCNYSIPSNVNQSETIVEIIKNCLKVNPADRTDASTITRIMEENFVDLNSRCITPKTPSTIQSPTVSNSDNNINNSTTWSNVEQVLQNTTANVPGIAQSYFAGFGRYLRDTSNRVMQTVQSSIARVDLDITFFTSRFIVMSYPAEGLESAYRNHIDDVRAVLESRDYKYSVINISGRSYDSSKFGTKIKVIDGGTQWKDPKRVASLQSIITLCDFIFKWLNQSDRHSIVIHCMDGKTNSAMLTISFFILIGLFDDYHKAHKYFLSRRNPIELTASHHRYLNYLNKLKTGNCLDFFSLKKNVLLKSIKMTGIPLFTKIRDGCRPFIELFTNSNTKLYSTFADYEKLIQYTRGQAEIVLWKDINQIFDLSSDICLIISHARATIGSKMLNPTKLTAIRITSSQFNLFFECSHENGPHKLILKLTDLDDIEELDRFPFDFQIELEFNIIDSEYGVQQILQYSEINENEILLINKPECIFMDDIEYRQFLESNGLKSPMESPNEINVKHNSSSPSSDLSNDTPFFEMGSNNDNKSINEKVIDQPCQPRTEVLVSMGSIEQPEEIPKTENQGIGNDCNKKLIDDEFADFFGTQQTVSPNQNSSAMNSDLDDIFKLNTEQNNTTQQPPLMTNKFDFADLFKNPSTPNLNVAAADPFASIIDLNSNINKPASAQTSSMPRTSSYNAFPPAQEQTNNKTSNGGNKPKDQKPNYSRNNFEEIANKTGLKNTRVLGNEFEDLLTGFHRTVPTDNKPNKTMAELRKEYLLKSGADPIKIKISEWTNNKEKNIRALLSTLDTVVWEGCNWQKIGMNQLITFDDVKKMYRKACLAIHPDKLVGNANEEFAKYIFMELNDAWSKFEADSK